MSNGWVGGAWGPPPHRWCHFISNSWWPMGVGGWGPPSYCSCHFNSQLLMTVGGVVGLGRHPPHCSCHFSSQLLMTNGGWVGSSFSLLMSLQCSNCWWPLGVGGGGSSSLLMSPTKLIAAQQWNETDFHHCMPAQLKLVPALWLQLAILICLHGTKKTIRVKLCFTVSLEDLMY